MFTTTATTAAAHQKSRRGSGCQPWLLALYRFKILRLP
jgi:hypothetical protein